MAEDVYTGVSLTEMYTALAHPCARCSIITTLSHRPSVGKCELTVFPTVMSKKTTGLLGFFSWACIWLQVGMMAYPTST